LGLWPNLFEPQARRYNQIVSGEAYFLFIFERGAAVSKTSRSIFNTLRLTLRAQPRSAKFQIRGLPFFAHSCPKPWILATLNL